MFYQKSPQTEIVKKADRTEVILKFPPRTEWLCFLGAFLIFFIYKDLIHDLIIPKTKFNLSDSFSIIYFIFSIYSISFISLFILWELKGKQILTLTSDTLEIRIWPYIPIYFSPHRKFNIQNVSEMVYDPPAISRRQELPLSSKNGAISFKVRKGKHPQTVRFAPHLTEEQARQIITFLVSERYLKPDQVVDGDKYIQNL